jgi:hypothetical protein
VEGQARGDCGKDMFNCAAQIVENIFSRYSQHLYIIAIEPCVSFGVPARPIPSIMSFAIDFHCKPCIAAVEIEHIGACWMLPPEFHTVWTSPQFAP